MSARPWRVETRAPGSGPGSEWHRNANYGAFGSVEAANGAVCKWKRDVLNLTGRPILASYRLVNRDTAEVINLE